ncbi:integral membrane protein [Nemania sp. FL0916]|nr:integral membrane protein [Nemania sp. FL0916]
MDQSSTQPPPDVDVGAGLVVVAWVLGAIGVLLLAMRMYARAFIIKKFGWDDWTMVLAVALALATNITVTLMVHYGVGRHAAYLNPGQLSNALYMVWLTIALSTASAAIGKISIALLLIRLINRSRWRDTFLWTLISLLIVVNALLIIVIFVQCTPVIKLWDPTVPGACWSPTIQLDIWYFQGAFSALSDLILALFPLPIIWKLQIPLLSKAVLGFLMSLGVK